jgi:O-phosphoseryl-tRNA(Sec) kinase
MKRIYLSNNSNFLIILVGLPASGKSTFAFKLKEILEPKFQIRVKIIDPDKIREKAFPNSFDFKNEPRIRKKNIKLIKKNLRKGEIVISDDLNYYSSMRHDLKLIADNLNIKFYIIHISTSLNLCLKRNEERGNPIPNKVIEKIYKRFDNFNKYKWDKPFETYDISQISKVIQFAENLSNKITLNLQEQKERKEPIEIKPSTSIREMLDLITRKYVGELLKNPKYQSSKRKILEKRKLYVKSRSDEEFDDKRILEDFKRFLNENLND